MIAPLELRTELEKLRTRALIVGVAGLALCALGALLAPQQSFRSYLLAFLFVASVPLGSLSLLMVQHLSGGRWGFALQRPLEAAARTIPLLALLFVPVVLGMHHLYEWSHEEVVASDPLVSHRALWMNGSGFVARAIVYFGAWSAMALLLARWSRAQDLNAIADADRRMRVLSGPGLVVYGVTLTGASLDWAMSLEVHWFSTMYGMLFAASNALTALVFAILVIGRLARHEPVARVATADRLQDFGSLSFALVMVWAYLSFAQFLIVWSGNLPEETTWYLSRSSPGWRGVAVFLVLFHFAAPFFLLMVRRNKRHVRMLAKIAAMLLLMRVVDIYWHVVPAFHPEGLHLHVFDLAAFAGVAGLWLAAFLRLLLSAPLLPLQDPRLAAAIAEVEHA